MPIGIPLVSKFDPKGFNQASSATRSLGKTLGNIGRVAGVAFAAAGAAAVAFGSSSIKAASESVTISRGLSNAVKNAERFGGTAADIDKATDALDAHSTKLAELSGVDDELLNQIKTHFLAVPAIAAIGIEGLNSLAGVAADVAAGTGKDIEGVSNSIAKALENPSTALSKLERAGIFVSDSQKALYDSMVAAGDAVGAQGFLIDTLGEKYAGAAEAAANPFDRLGVIFENLQETVGAALLPAIESIVPIVQEFISKLTADPAFTVFLSGLASAFMSLITALMPLMEPLTSLINTLMPPLMSIFEALIPVIVLLVDAFVPLIEGILPILASLITELTPIFMQLVEGLIVPLIPIVLLLVEAFMPLIEAVLPILSSLLTALMPIIILVAKLIAGNLTRVINLFIGCLVQVAPVVEFIGQMIGRVFGAIGAVVSGNLNGAITIFEGFLNFMIDGINKLIEPLNNLLDGISKVTGGAISLQVGTIPNISLPRLAKGGIVMPSPGGTIAQIAEAGQPEAVIPLDRLGSIVGRGGGQVSAINITVNAGMGADGAQVGEQIVTAIRKYERTSGRVFAPA